MGLAVVVFVPEGITFISDGLVEGKNSELDDVFLHKKQRNIFSYKDRFLICAQISHYVYGVSCSYYITKILIEMEECSFNSTEDFCREFRCRILNIFPQEIRVAFYIAGIDRGSKEKLVPNVFLIDKNQISLINRGNNGEVVYNYHSIGYNFWIDKLLFYTTQEMDENQRTLDIDFSKYSLNEAVDFGVSMQKITHKMDNFLQFKQMVGEYISVGYITIWGKVVIKNLYG